jgi:hypothetical protein
MDPAPWPDNLARLVAFDPGSGSITATLHQQTTGLGAQLASIELDAQGELFLCDRDAVQPGMRIFDASTHVLLDVVDVGLPPYDVLFVQPDPPIAVDPVAAPAPRARLGQNAPNPFRPTTRIPFTLAHAARVRLDIFDVRGRLVARMIDRRLGAGEHAVRWDGRRLDGQPAASGIYVYRLVSEDRGPAAAVTRRMTLLR